MGMNRRVFSGIIGSVAVGALIPEVNEPTPPWITIAALGTNDAGRIYEEAHMTVLARDVVPGTKVMDWFCDGYDGGDLTCLRGVVTEARVNAGLFQVRLKWFSKPKETSWVGIHGEAVMMGGGHFELLNVKHLDVTAGGSCFPQATAV